MKKFLFLPIILLALSAVSFAQKTAPASVVEQNLRRHIEYLASDKLEGRRTGEPGAFLAAGYVAKQFADLRLKGGVKNGNKAGYLQAFPYVTGVEINKEKTNFTLKVGDTNAKDVLARPVAFSPNAAIDNTGVIFAGYGIVAQEANRDDYANIDAKGKVVLVFDGNPDSDNPHSPFVRFDVRTKALIAKDHGAVGLLVISREDRFEDEKLTRLSYDQTLGEAALPTFVVSQNLHTLAQNNQLTVSFSIDLVKKTVDAYNVIGILPGTDPKLKDEAIVIGAHYDHLGHGGQGSLAANSTEIHHGADDNASGTAAVIELSRQFVSEARPSGRAQRAETRPSGSVQNTGAQRNKRTIIFICFSGEEEGLLGSNYYVNNPVWPLEKTVAMINMDMIGRLNDNKLTVGGIGTASEWKELTEKINKIEFENVSILLGGNGKKIDNSYKETLLRFNLQLNEDGFGPSDHSSFYGKKIPVLFFFTGTHNDYHKPTDTADKINYKGEADIISYITSIEQAIDQNPVRPTYTVAKTTMQGGRSGFNISLGTIPNYADSTDGLLLDGVRDGSPADKAGVKAGDKVVKLAGHDVRNVMDYTYILGEMKAGVEYEIVVLRGGERLTLKIVPVKR